MMTALLSTFHKGPRHITHWMNGYMCCVLCMWMSECMCVYWLYGAASDALFVKGTCTARPGLRPIGKGNKNSLLSYTHTSTQQLNASCDGLA